MTELEKAMTKLFNTPCKIHTAAVLTRYFKNNPDTFEVLDTTVLRAMGGENLDSIIEAKEWLNEVDLTPITPITIRGVAILEKINEIGRVTDKYKYAQLLDLYDAATGGRRPTDIPSVESYEKHGDEIVEFTLNTILDLL